MSSLTPRPLTPSGTTLSMADRELDRLHDHVVAGFPHEVVGILAGDRATNEVTRVRPLENATADDPARRFHVSGLTLMKAERALEAEGLESGVVVTHCPASGERYLSESHIHAEPG